MKFDFVKNYRSWKKSHFIRYTLYVTKDAISLKFSVVRFITRNGNGQKYREKR